MELHKYFIHSISLSIIFCGISVSLSQLFLAFALLFMLLEWKKLQFTPLLGISLLLFASYFVSFFFHYYQSGFDPAYLARAFRSELKDFFLFSGFLVMQNLEKKDSATIIKSFRILLLVLVVTGFVAIFSQVRLARLISDLYSTSASWKFQHHITTILGIHLYLPIGLMNTHLTFGGLLLFLFPSAVFAIHDSYKKSHWSKTTIIQIIIVLALGMVFLFNNARSAIAGALIGIAIGIVHNIKFGNLKLPVFSLKPVVVVLLFLLLAAPVLHNNQTMKKIIAPLLGEEKHTDSGRTFIWNSTFPLIKENVLLGVGPGNYNQEIEKSRKKLSAQNESLLFFYEVAQRGHAHNDYFHLFAIAGIFSVFFYLLLSGIITSMILHLNSEFTVLFYALPGFFFSGLLQCYFQDDEVVIVFWFLTGFLNHLYASKDRALAKAQA